MYVAALRCVVSLLMAHVDSAALILQCKVAWEFEFLHRICTSTVLEYSLLGLLFKIQNGSKKSQVLSFVHPVELNIRTEQPCHMQKQFYKRLCATAARVNPGFMGTQDTTLQGFPVAEVS